MSEGLFRPDQLTVPGLSADNLLAAMVRILPKTLLILDIVDTQAEADERGRNEAHPDGSEIWYRFFARQDLSRVNDPEFAMGMVRHEFSNAVKSDAQFPVSVRLDGGGTGFAIDASGHVLTNYHLVTGEVANYKREPGVLHSEVQCQGLRAQVATRTASGGWEWVDAQEVWLVSNPPTERALWDDGHGRLHPREDTALVRVVPPPSDFVSLSQRSPTPGEQLWMAGFPIRTARARDSLLRNGYVDADSTLRVSTGTVTEVEANDYFTTDIDGSMGNSGSPVFDVEGKVVGIFSRVSGNGPRNAFEYGHMQRVQVSIQMAIRGLQLQDTKTLGLDSPSA